MMKCGEIRFREEAKPMSDFLSSKDLRIHAASNWVIPASKYR